MALVDTRRREAAWRAAKRARQMRRRVGLTRPSSPSMCQPRTCASAEHSSMSCTGRPLSSWRPAMAACTDRRTWSGLVDIEMWLSTYWVWTPICREGTE